MVLSECSIGICLRNSYSLFNNGNEKVLECCYFDWKWYMWMKYSTIYIKGLKRSLMKNVSFLSSIARWNAYITFFSYLVQARSCCFSHSLFPNSSSNVYVPLSSMKSSMNNLLFSWWPHRVKSQNIRLKRQNKFSL